MTLFLAPSQAGKKAAPIAWNDIEHYNPATNTTLVSFFCTTLSVLEQKLQQVWDGRHGALPDVLVFNVGLWHLTGPVVALRQRKVPCGSRGNDRGETSRYP